MAPNRSHPPNGPVTLRPARTEDSGDVADIWMLGWPDGHLGHVPDALVEARTADSFRDRATEQVRATTVAVVDGAVAGFVMVVDDEVEQVYVAARHRGAGIADALIAEAERQVGSDGHHKAWLAVVAGNLRARRFYERSGWRDEGPLDYPAPVADGSITVPCHRYTKTL
jgi:GNAT superfamily N-acetyltransferase